MPSSVTENLKIYRLSLAGLVAYMRHDGPATSSVLRDLWEECDGFDEFVRAMLAAPYMVADYFNADEEFIDAAQDLIARLAVHEEN